MDKKRTYASIEVLPPGPTPTFVHDNARNLSLVGTGCFDI